VAPRCGPGPHAPFGIVADIVHSVVEFICEKPSERADERILKTVMFTDIVGSRKLNVHSDAHCGHQLNAHDKVVAGCWRKRRPCQILGAE
jgi:hypothetical protein